MTEQAVQFFWSNLVAYVFQCNLCDVASLLQLYIIITTGLVAPAEGGLVEVCSLLQAAGFV